ncbi:MAG TPA: ABC transporter permease [Candidatus Limnocylindria bacterium]|nr:ABC transporter permease [Candidatus Limnocylindria bacterium]
MVLQLAHVIGSIVLGICHDLGAFSLFFAQALKTAFTTRPKLSKLFTQMQRIGVDSLMVVILTGLSTGMVFALQTYIGFKRVGGEQFIGAVVALGMIRELGPVLTGLMVTGRAGSAITAEIGTMRITEQIDALETLQINTFQYLVVPRLLAGTIILPFLTIFAMIFGIFGGYIICVYVLELSPEDYTTSMRAYVELTDITRGLTKAGFFGLILAWVGTYKGYMTTGGAKGVGISTTQSVVTSSILILIANYFLTKLLEHM